MYVRYALAFLTAAAMGLTVFMVQSDVGRNFLGLVGDSSSSASWCGEGSFCNTSYDPCCDGTSCALDAGGGSGTCGFPSSIASSEPASSASSARSSVRSSAVSSVPTGTTGGFGTTGGIGTTGGTGGASSEPSDPVCGNGDVESGEECDDGDTDLSDACVECQTATCGDGHVHSGSEQCDDGNSNNTDTCTNTCTVASPVCGNGIVQVGEQCDDGNSVNTDTCSNACKTVTPPASSKAPTPSSRAASSSSQCPQTCTPPDLLYTLSLGMLGNPGTCTASCPGSSSSPASSASVSSAKSSAKSSASSSTPAGVCCKIKTDEGGYQEGVVACMYTATRAACETVPANKWLPGETSVSNCQETCKLPDLVVSVGLNGIMGGEPKEEPISIGGFTLFGPSVFNHGEAAAKNVKTTITFAAPIKPDDAFTPQVTNGTCTINAAKTVVTCTTPSLAPGAMFMVSMTLAIPSSASPMPACNARLPIVVSTSTTDTELRTDNNSQNQKYVFSCGVCCPNPGSSDPVCSIDDYKPKALCPLDDPFLPPTWLPSPNTCASCPKASSSSSASAGPKQACCTYSGDNGWNVVSCTAKEKKSGASEICHDLVPGTLLKSDWRPDIAISDCTPAKAQEVCAKREIDLKLTKTYTGPSQPNVGDELSYDIEVTNVTDGDPAVDVTVNDFRNPNLQFVRATGATCSVLGMSQAVSCDLDNLAPGASKKITLVFKLLDRGTSPCTVINTALVYADNKETMISDNYANSPLNAYCWGASASSAKATSSVSSKTGGSCCLRLENKKWYPGSLYGHYTSSCLPAADESACSKRKGTTVTSAFDQYLVESTHYADAQQCAAMKCSDYVTPKPCCNNGCSLKTPYECTQGGGVPSDKNSCDSTNVCPLPASSAKSASSKSTAKSSSSTGPSTDISIKKELAPVAAGAKRKAGDKVVYTVTITNHGEVEATGVKISDLFPYGLSITSMPSNCTDIPGLVTCTDITVPARGTKDITIEATIDEAQSICTDTFGVGENRVSVSASPQFDKNGMNNIASVSGFRIDCPTWEVKKEFVTTGTYSKGQTVKFKLSFKRIGGKYTPNGSGYDNDYYEDLGTNLDFVTVGNGCTVADSGANGRVLKCQFPEVAKDATHTVEIVATIKPTVCSTGNTGKFSNAVSAKRGKFTSGDKVLGTKSVEGTVDCGKEEVKYCCSDNKCMEKKSGVVCTNDNKEYPASPSNCGGECGGSPTFCCTTPGNQCVQKGTTGTTCTTAGYGSSTCNGACPPAPKQYCCSSNQCTQVGAGVTCDQGSTPATDATCGGPGKCGAPTKGACCGYTGGFGNLEAGRCMEFDEAKCTLLRGKWEGLGVKCGTVSCPQPKPCCFEAKAGEAACSMEVPSLCSTDLHGTSVDAPQCGVGVCPPLKRGACCTSAKCESDKTQGECTDLNGEWNEGKTCDQVNQCKKGPVVGAGCCVRDIAVGEGMTCNPNLTEDDCDDIAGQVWYGESCSAKCGTVPVSACAEGCFPALANGTCPVDPGLFVRTPTTTWGKLVAWLTGAPLEAELIDFGGGCCCPSGGGTGGAGGKTGGGTGGSAASTGGTSGGSQASVATSRANSSMPSGKQCGACVGTSQTACENGPNLCQWKGSTFGFVTVLFGGASGTCAPAPQCISGGTSSVSKASVSSSSRSAASASSAKSSVSPEEYIWYVIGLTAFDAPACSDGEDNDQDGRVDSDDPGCYDTLMAQSTLSRFAAAIGLVVKPWGTYMPQRTSELCDPGMFETEGKCVALPMCPEVTGNAQQDKVNALLKCGAGCQGNSRCTGICACNCTASPADAKDAMEDVQVCFNTCLARTSHPICVPGSDGKTPQGLSPAECCRVQCVTARCGV